MVNEVKQRLESLGYTPKEQDSWPLGFVTQKVERDICGNCNLHAIPAGLRAVAVDMAVGEFLLAKKAYPGGLEGFDLETAVKSVSAGDTTVAFGVGEGTKTPEQRLDALIAHLMKGKGSFAAYRRIAW